VFIAHVLLLSAWLDLRWNALEGTLPTELALLRENLAILGLNGNQYTGSIPSEIALLTSLLELDLFNNNFNGTIPEEIYFSGMDKLNALLIGENNLSGTISRKCQGLRWLFVVVAKCLVHCPKKLPTLL
jgi:hypothetical protein